MYVSGSKISVLSIMRELQCDAAGMSQALTWTCNVIQSTFGSHHDFQLQLYEVAKVVGPGSKEAQEP